MRRSLQPNAYNQALRKLEKTLKRIITVNHTKSFFCDSHVRICYNCVQLRYLIKYGIQAPRLLIRDRKGTLWEFHRPEKQLPIGTKICRACLDNPVYKDGLCYYCYQYKITEEDVIIVKT